MHIHNDERLDEAERKPVDATIILDWKQVYSSVYSLSFMRSFVHALQLDVTDTCISSFVDINHELTSNCHDAIEILQESKDHRELLMYEHINFCGKPDNLYPKLCMWHLGLVWGQLQYAFWILSSVLYHFFWAPESTATVHRNHIINKLVMSKRRCRMMNGKAEK